MQQIKSVSANADGGGMYLPPEKIGNKRIYPVQNEGEPVKNTDGVSAAVMPTGESVQGKREPTMTGAPVVQPQPVADNPAQQITAKPQGLLQQAVQPTTSQQSLAQPVQSQPSQAETATIQGAAVPTATFQKDGYTGAQNSSTYSYSPSSDSLVENRIAGLLDPNSAIMRKAVAEANSLSASRGMQSSSIGNEIALSTMIDKALPIAQQDANTYNQSQQLGWQQNWQTAENNINRQHDSAMTDKQGQYQLANTNAQIAASAAESANNRVFQASQTERSAQLQEQRDRLLQDMSNQTLDKQYLQQLETLRVQYDQADKQFTANLSASQQAEYRNAVTSAYNTYLQQVGAIYADPNMTAEQKAAGAQYLQQQLDAQRKSLETLYLVTGQQAVALPSTGPQTGVAPITTTPAPVYGGNQP